MKQLSNLFDLASWKLKVTICLSVMMGLFVLVLFSTNRFYEIKTKNLNHIQLALSYNHITPIEEDLFLSSLREGTQFYDYNAYSGKGLDPAENIFCSRNNCYQISFSPLAMHLSLPVLVYCFVLGTMAFGLIALQKKFNKVVQQELESLSRAFVTNGDISGVEIRTQELKEVLNIISRNKSLNSELYSKQELAHDMKAPIEALRITLKSKNAAGKENLLQMTLDRLENMNLKILKGIENKIDFCDIDKLLELVIEEAKLFSNGISFKVTGDQGLMLKCDSEKLHRAFINILKNSIEASGGKCLISIKVKKSDSGVRFSFEDSGPGFSSEVLCDFNEGNKIKSSKCNGSGIGLRQVAGIVDELKGTIQISNSNIGARTEIFI